jgi:hypothetical protein
MTTEISFADWVDVLAIELTFVELYRSATPSEKREMTETLRRLAEGIGEKEVAACASQVPNFERALRSFSSEEQSRFAPQFSMAVTEFAQHLAHTFADPD